MIDNHVSSRKIETGRPELVELFNKFDSAMGARKISYILTSVFRSAHDQSILFDQGRIFPGKIVTNAKAYQSAHNFGMAFDIAIVRNGKCVWEINDPAWSIAGECGRMAGLEWGGDWKFFREAPHFQVPNWSHLITEKEG